MSTPAPSGGIKRTFLWGEIEEDEQKPERKLKKPKLEDDSVLEEEMENREETLEEEEDEEDDGDEEEDEDEEASAEEEATSGTSAGSQDDVRNTSSSAAGTTTAAEYTAPSTVAEETGAEESELPKELEAVIRAAYKPEGPKVVFPFRIPDENDNKEDEEVPYEYYRTNDIIHHTIRLNQHYRIMSTLLHIAQNTKGTEFRKFPPIPDMVIRKRKVKKYKNFDYPLPVYQYPRPYLEKKTIQTMLQKSVLIILAQLGVDKATKSVVLVLVDVVKEFLRKMCLTCNTYCQWDLTRGHMDFRAVMHRTLVDMGLRKGQEDIKEYCESIVKTRNRAFRKTFHLVRLYLKTVHAARQRARLLGTPSTSRQTAKPNNARTMLPQQGLSVYLPRGMQTITVMERGRRPHMRRTPTFPTSAPSPILASKFAATYAQKAKEEPPELSAILRPPSETNEQ